MIKFILLVSITSLITAYGAEYIFGIKPCILCIYERVPYMIIAVLSAGSLLFKKNLLPLIMMIFIASSTLSFYHVGVEQHIFEATDECANKLKPATSIEELKKQLEANERSSCAEPEFRFLSISFAGWNLLLSIFMSFISIVEIRKCKKNYQEVSQKISS
jgi:disulfide bond formation protein DsbB